MAVAALRAEFSAVRVHGARCDVTDPASVRGLLLEVQRAFAEPIRYLGANAGVLFPRATVLTGSADEWALTLKVNVLGVVNTLQVFVPAMLAHEQTCLVVNTASLAGLLSGMSGPYGASKHACVALSEALHDELQWAKGGERVRLHVLCPGMVNTSLKSSSNETTERRADIGGPIDGTKRVKGDAHSAATVAIFADERWTASMDADFVAEELFAGIARGDFYVVVESAAAMAESLRSVEARSAGIASRPTRHRHLIARPRM